MIPLGLFLGQSSRIIKINFFKNYVYVNEKQKNSGCMVDLKKVINSEQLGMYEHVWRIHTFDPLLLVVVVAKR